MGASKTCILLMTLSLAYVVSAQEVVRRVPQGFLGMRGKKYYEVGENDQLYKRKPQFFVGVKGKKDYQLSDDINFKRAPMGFVGMRGKKDPMYADLSMVYPDNYEYIAKPSGSLIGQIDYSTDDNIQEYPMLNEVLEEYLQKLRENMNTDVSNELSSDRSDIINNEVEKRANIHKFFGVRGKKSVQTKRPDVSFRGKFIGVRGKKDMKNSGAEFLLDGPWPKRRMQSGFLGMRGKKWTDDDTVLDSEPSNDIIVSN